MTKSSPSHLATQGQFSLHFVTERSSGFLTPPSYHLHCALSFDYDDHGYQAAPLVKVCVLCVCVCGWGVTLLAGTVAFGPAPKPNLFLAAT